MVLADKSDYKRRYDASTEFCLVQLLFHLALLFSGSWPSLLPPNTPKLNFAIASGQVGEGRMNVTLQDNCPAHNFHVHNRRSLIGLRPVIRLQPRSFIGQQPFDLGMQATMGRCQSLVVLSLRFHIEYPALVLLCS
jgi:hypothetical protein